jgi:uncharacterized membrane protein (DUF485 family)
MAVDKGSVDLREKMEESIWSNQKFHSLVLRRNRFMRLLFALTLVMFFGFSLLLMFMPSLMAISIWPGATTKIGIPLGMGVVFISFLLTGLYVYVTNRIFDPMTKEILEEARKAGNEKA